MLQINWNLLFTIINLIVLYLLMKKFLFGPVVKIMEQRKAIIEDGLTKAQSTQDEAKKLKAEYESALSGAKNESEQILSDAKQNAKKEYDRIVAEAEHKSERMMETARETIEVERAQTMNALKSEIATVAMSAATNVIGNNTDVIDNKELYDQFLKEVGDMDEESDNK